MDENECLASLFRQPTNILIIWEFLRISTNYQNDVLLTASDQHLGNDRCVAIYIGKFDLKQRLQSQNIAKSKRKIYHKNLPRKIYHKTDKCDYLKEDLDILCLLSKKYEKYMCLSKKIRVLTLSRFKRQKIKLVNSDGQRLASKAKPKTMITSSFKSI